MIYGQPITFGGGGKAKKPLSSLAQGSLVSILEDGRLVPFYVAKHDYEADLNGSGRTLLVRKDAYGTMAWNSTNVNTYANSTVDTWLNGDYKELLSSTVKSQIGATQFKYTVGNGNNSVTTLTKSVFLLSLSEFGKTDSYANTEGSALPIASSLQVAYLDGSAVVQLTRSPYTQASTVAYCLMPDGAVNSITCSDSGRCSRPCFTLPADMALREEPYADGSFGLADEDVLFDTETASTYVKVVVNYTNGVSDLDADTLHQIAMAISSNPNITKETSVVYYDSGDVHRKISTGDQVTLSLNGTNYAFDIIGFNHDDLVLGTVYGSPTATGKAGVTLQMHGVHGTTYQINTSNTNSGGWKNSNMRTSTMLVMQGYLPDDWKNIAKFVNKAVGTGGGSTSGTETVSDCCFLLADIEVFGTTGGSVVGEGSQYAYYKAGNSKIKMTSAGFASNWWLRSPYAGGTGFCGITTGGAVSGWNATGKYGVAFAFCI